MQYIGLSGRMLEPTYLPSFSHFDIEGLAKMPELSGTVFFIADKQDKHIHIYDGNLDLILGKVSYSFDAVTDTCFCGGLALDESGTRVYALVLDPPVGYIRVFAIIDRRELGIFSLEPIRTVWIPIQQEVVRTGIHNADATMTNATEIADINIGSILRYSDVLTGSGITVWGGYIYVVTYREVLFEDIEERSFSAYLSLLSLFHVESGYCKGHCTLGASSFKVTQLPYVSNPFPLEAECDRVVHGLGVYDRKLVAGVAIDGTLTTIIPGTLLPLEVGQVYKSRGPRQLALIPLAEIHSKLYLGPTVTKNSIATISEAFESELLFDAMLPADFHIDQDSWKLFCAYGNRLFLFDLLPYILEVQYTAGYYLGHVIDFDTALEADKVYSKHCYFKNSSQDTLVGVELELKDDGSKLFGAMFLSADNGDTLSKVLSLGDVLPMGSKSFDVFIFTTGVSRLELFEMSRFDIFRVPLIITLEKSK